MKKLALIFLIGIIVIVGIAYMYLNYKANYYEAKRENNQFESYLNQEFYGADVVTLINKAYEINKRDGNFKLTLSTVEDPDSGIQGYTFEIYDTRNTDDEPVKTIESSSPETLLEIDDVIQRNVGYYYKVIVDFYDNEKYCTFESEASNVFTMDGVEFPSVRFEETEVTFERIEGTIRISDNGNTIDEENDEFTDIMSDVDAYREEVMYKTITGVSSLNDLDAYFAEMKNRGIERAIEIQQAAYDRYMAD